MAKHKNKRNVLMKIDRFLRKNKLNILFHLISIHKLTLACVNSLLQQDLQNEKKNHNKYENCIINKLRNVYSWCVLLALQWNNSDTPKSGKNNDLALQSWKRVPAYYFIAIAHTHSHTKRVNILVIYLVCCDKYVEIGTQSRVNCVQSKQKRLLA